MSILDKDLVDQRTFEEQFMEMLYELYERMMNGKLIIDEIEKNQFTEREIGGLMWRVSGVKWGINKGYMAIYDINDALYKSVLYSIEDEEQVPMLNKEYARDTINKLIDLYWDKYIYRYFIFEVRRVDGDEWVRVSEDVSLGDVMIRKIIDMRDKLCYMYDSIMGKIEPEECKELLDWVKSGDESGGGFPF